MINFSVFVFGYLFTYICMAILAYLIFSRLCELPQRTVIFCHDNEVRSVERYKNQLALIMAITWPVSWFFLCGCSIGSEIYTRKIIKGNEEIRIAAWFV